MQRGMAMHRQRTGTHRNLSPPVGWGTVTRDADGPPIRLFSTLTREVADFVPLDPPHVGMYSCGPTVYSDQHIGNMRAYIFADTLKRALTWKGFEVRHVINITDVGHLTSDADEGEDKLELAARREHTDAWAIAAKYTSEFKRDLARLRVIEPDVWCKATDHIAEMIAFAQVLDAGGWCYALPSAFTSTRPERWLRQAGQARPGRPARRGPRRAGRGQAQRERLRCLRTSAPGENRQMEWDSPWGRGAPGWHLECSVMSMQYLGSHFDIHTGGVDHIPVHHTNEIAQSEAYLRDGQPWVGWWLHGEFINLRGAKMAKSAGGTVLLSDLACGGYHSLVYRYLLLGAHYRSQTEFSRTAMDGARTGLRRLLDRYAAARTAPAGRLGEAAAAISTHSTGRLRRPEHPEGRRGGDRGVARRTGRRRGADRARAKVRRGAGHRPRRPGRPIWT